MAGRFLFPHPTKRKINFMMQHDFVFTDVEQVSVAWLTAVLTQSGALTSGKVVSFETDGGAGNWSQNARLTLTYSDDAKGNCPTSLFLKLVDTDTGDGEFFLPSEVTYYTRDYIDLPDAPLVRCYHAAYNAAQNRYHLLLDDLSETHKAAYDLAPNLAHGEAFAEAVAILHAHWWGEARLQAYRSPFHDDAHIKKFVAIGQPGIEHVLTLFGNELEPHWPDLIQQIFDKLPDRLVQRAQDRTHFTRIHGDPNQGNLLVPKVGERPLYIIDLQPFDWSLNMWLGAYDLAYLMAIFWKTEWRRELELPILRHYHTTLIERGVSGYSWERFYDDYRLCVLLGVTIAVEYMRDGGDPDWNWFRLGIVKHALTAVDDLGCQQLL